MSKIENRNLFICISLFSRFCQGIGSALSSTLVYSISASLCEADQLEVTMGYMELAYSLGLTIGPLIASFLFYLRGYSFPFYVFGLLALICIFFISNLEMSEEEEEESNYNFLQIIFSRVIYF